jgi:hypothetical protein
LGSLIIVWYTVGWGPFSTEVFTPRAEIDVGMEVARMLGTHFGGDCFQRLTVITCSKAKSVLWHRRDWVPMPSGSSNEMERDEIAPCEYLVGSRTHEGFWVMVRAV